MKITNENALTIKVEKYVHAEDIVAFTLLGPYEDTPDVLKNLPANAVIGQKLNGETYILTCEVQGFEDTETIEYNDQQYFVRLKEYSVLGEKNGKTKIWAVLHTKEPKGCRFDDPKIAKWFHERQNRIE